MCGATAWKPPSNSECVREASWLDLPRNQRNVADHGPPIWHWRVPLRTPSVRVDAYLGPHREGRPTQDKLLVVEYPDRLILAAADGVTPTEATPRVGELDGARYAARLVLSHVCAAPPSRKLASVFVAANAALLDEFVHRPRADLPERDRPQAAAVAVSLRLGSDATVEEVDCARAADCEIAVRRHDGWTRIAPEPMLPDDVQASLDRWDREHPDATYRQRIQAENQILRDWSQWNRTALGRFDRPRLDEPAVPADFVELLLATDGAGLSRFDTSLPGGPRSLMPNLRSAEAASRPRGRPHSDVAVLHVSFAQSASMR